MKKLLFALALPVTIIAGCIAQQDQASTKKTVSHNYANATVSQVNIAKVIYLPSARYPQTAKHILAAEKAGKSKICTLDRKDEKVHRKESLAGIPTKKGYDRDEFPMAMCKEGGYHANIMYISPKDNRGSGSWISHQVKGLSDGTKVEILVK
jgi:hypothetical protein